MKAMKIVYTTVANIALLLAPWAVFGQSAPNEPIKTALCDLTKDPSRFDGRIVEFRSEYVSDLGGARFVDEVCRAKVELGVSHVFDELKPGVGQYAYTETADQQSDEFQHFERLPWKTIQAPVTVRLLQDESYREFRKYADARFRWKDGGLCRSCPLYRTTVTATGRFDWFRKDWVAVRTDSAATPYIWAGGPLMRFTLQSVSRVAAIRIDPTAYSKSKRRNVSNEEANDLVCALTGGCSDGGSVLLPLIQAADDGFYHFDVWSSTSHVGFFDVDARTGDLWNGVICMRFETPSLVQLQRVIRKRIGMTDNEYRTTTATGPICGPGKKAEVFRGQ